MTYYLYEHEFRKYKDLPFLEDQIKKSDFKKFLDKLWQERNIFSLLPVNREVDDDRGIQQFFSFTDDGISAGKYFGLIKYGDNSIQVLPKIFQNSKIKDNQQEICKYATYHIIWWLSWCSKIRFPKSLAEWGDKKFEIIDLFILLFATITRDELIFNKQQSYVELEENIGTIRGRIDFGKYARMYSTGKLNIIPCIYDSLEFDNLYNRIIKCTSKLLCNITENEESKRLLNEIIWILDDVEDVNITTEDCSKVIVTPLKENMQIILDYCRMFLSGSSIQSDDTSLKIFAFLIPMEVLFQNFISNFIKEQFENRGIIGNISFEKKNNTDYLATETINGNRRNIFELKPDIYVRRDGGKKDIILDPKYKNLYFQNRADVSPSDADIDDVRQMIGYAIRYNLNRIYLLYPDTFNTDNILPEREYEIIDLIGGKNEIIYVACKRIPVIIKETQRFDDDDVDLQEIFSQKESELFLYFSQILYA
jgi:5-methylcytosine-specific restriction enzyme subunit McrC